MPTLRGWFAALIGPPRRSRAFPPSATTMSMSVPQRRDEDRLDGVHPVLRLLERDVAARLEDLVGHFDAVGHAEVLGDVAADGRLGVVKRGQAVHELDLRVAARLEQVERHLI